MPETLIPPARRHRHRYFGVLAPNSPLRTALTALATPAGEVVAAARIDPAAHTGPTPPVETTTKEPVHRQAAHYAWALLLARIYEVLPLLCPKCGGEMRIIAFITGAVAIRDILSHLGEPTSPPPLLPARSPPLWAMAGVEPDEINPYAQASPAYEFDQRIAW